MVADQMRLLAEMRAQCGACSDDAGPEERRVFPTGFGLDFELDADDESGGARSPVRACVGASAAAGGFVADARDASELFSEQTRLLELMRAEGVAFSDDERVPLPVGNGPQQRRKRKVSMGPNVLQTDGHDVPADAWKRFTPDVVDPKRC